MGGTPPEGKVKPRVGEAHCVVDPIDGGRMPGDGDIDILEVAGAYHEHLGRASLLGGAAVVAHASLNALRGQVVLDGGGGQQSGGAQHVVPAAMPMATRFDLSGLGDACDLGETR